jgi:hypothetical protein
MLPALPIVGGRKLGCRLLAFEGFVRSSVLKLGGGLPAPVARLCITPPLLDFGSTEKALPSAMSTRMV